MTEEKSTRIILTGDINSCSHCKEQHEKLKHFSGPAVYEYVDVNTDAGQESLKKYGVKEGEHVDIPLLKIESCDLKLEGEEKVKTNCKTKDWKEEFWADIEKNELPKEVYIE